MLTLFPDANSMKAIRATFKSAKKRRNHCGIRPAASA